ncbi:hypothetical protein HDU79_001500 [Rhizoclosmatium sp. JEL0117]|nr:hypothetical protein HDU79_001500 [Rhizoclosmatium sp. JEL0117]
MTPQLASELASVKQSLHTQSSIQDIHSTRLSFLETQATNNHRQVMHEIEKLQNSTKKHYTRLTSLPMDVVGRIMSWIDPVEVWQFRALSKGFRDLLSSNGFATLLVSRKLPIIDRAITRSKKPTLSDRMFVDTPSMYQAEYARKAYSHLTSLCWNDYDGPKFNTSIPEAWLRHLKNLTELKWIYCNWTGPIPREMGDLVNLKTLELSHNHLSGEIPSELWNLVNLEVLELNNTGLTGRLPAELGKLTSLVKLYIWDSEMTGPIPPEIGNLQNLNELFLVLQENSEVRTVIPSELGRLTNLVLLNLASCHLVGSIPRELGQLVSLRHMYLDENRLGGNVPIELAALELEECDLSNNAGLNFSFHTPAGWRI